MEDLSQTVNILGYNFYDNEGIHCSGPYCFEKRDHYMEQKHDFDR